MRELVKYVLGIEKMAGDLYMEASVFLKEDKNFAAFLNLLAEDEAYHAEVMTKADEHLGGKIEEAPAFISLNNAVKEEIERPFTRLQEMLRAGNVKREDMIECIVSMEFSEWNDVFLYIVNTLRDRDREFQEVAARIHQHRRRIEDFLKQLPQGQELFEKMHYLSPVWVERILVVEDEPAILELLSAILKRDGIVEEAENGKKGLKKVTNYYYDAIISDVDMPVMDGIKFYQEAVKVDPNIGKRFLFLAGYATSDNVAFFAENGLSYLIKPVDLLEIKRTVGDIIRGSSEHS